MTAHIFYAAQPYPLPVGWSWWKDQGRRATCSCGWRADSDSTDTRAASERWRTEHYAEVAA